MNKISAKQLIEEFREGGVDVTYVTENYLGQVHLWSLYPKYKAGIWYSLEKTGTQIFGYEIEEFIDKKSSICKFDYTTTLVVEDSKDADVWANVDFHDEEICSMFKWLCVNQKGKVFYCRVEPNLSKKGTGWDISNIKYEASHTRTDLVKLARTHWMGSVRKIIRTI